jgi:hypothetical protein
LDRFVDSHISISITRSNRSLQGKKQKGSGPSPPFEVRKPTLSLTKTSWRSQVISSFRRVSATNENATAKIYILGFKELLARAKQLLSIDSGNCVLRGKHTAFQVNGD